MPHLMIRCHICKKKKLDRDLDMLSVDLSPELTHHVLYCKNNAYCKKDAERKIKKVKERI